MWALLMTAYRTGLSLQTAGVDSMVFAVACTFSHSAGCVWNDICDREFDARVGTHMITHTPSHQAQYIGDLLR